jgi:FkbM family methyltransferase
MKSLMRKINLLLNTIGLHVISANGWRDIQRRAEQLEELETNQHLLEIDLQIASMIVEQSTNLQTSQTSRFFEVRDKATAAFRQDLIALTLNNFKENGVFIEVGACDGLATSNTYLLETSFGWRGLLIEPARIWHEKLVQNRSADLDFRCAWKVDGERVSFSEKVSPGRSGIADTTTDVTATRANYEIETVTLRKILEEKSFLQKVDFLSVDTEGSEYEVLLGFPFELSKPSFICVEHNFESEKRLRIRTLLEDHGYANFLENHSYVDDWYYLSKFEDTSPILSRKN